VPSWRQRAYDELPALSVRRGELRRSLRIVTWGYIFALLWMACCSASHLIVFTRMLGFRDIHFGMLTAIAYVAALGQLVAAVLVERTGLKKFQFIHCASVARLLWLAVAALPLVLPIPSPWAVYAMLLILLGSSFMSSLATPVWFTWMGDLIPKRIRGRYLGYRTRAGALVRLPFVIVLGLVLDLVSKPGAPQERSAQPVLFWTTCAIFALGAVFGTIDILLFHRIRDVIPTSKGPIAASQPPKTPGLRELLVQPLQDRVFRHYVLYGIAITFAVSVGGSFYWLNAMENLGFSKLAVNVVFLVISPIAGLLSAKGWGRLIDSWGRRPALILATIGTVFSISHWFFLTRYTPAPPLLADAANWLACRVGPLVGRPEWVWIHPETPLGAYLVACLFAVIGGVAWTGVTMAQTGVMFGFSDVQGRTKYVAATAVLLGVGGTLGALCGGVVASLLAPLQDHRIGPFLWNNWHAVFLLSLLARFASLSFLVHMPDPGSRRVRHLVRAMRGNVYNVIAPRFLYPLRIFGFGRRSRGKQPTDAPEDEDQFKPPG